ncbi:cytochrome c biogenesis protein ResB [bacterium]|nr:cytochrome c biogenesis protein ResB [bacterium]
MGNWLTSMRTAVGLLVAMTLLATAGVLIGQQLPPEVYVERFGPVLGAIVFHSGLANVFRTWYFVALAGLLTLSTVVCSLRRITRFRTASGRRLRTLGSLITHLSIALIAAGGIWTAAGGLRYAAPRYMEAGDMMEVPEGGFSIRVDAARTEFAETGALSEYVSEVTVFEAGEPVREHRIEVNHPLIHNGVGVYQFEMLPAADSAREVLLGIVVPVPGEAPLHLEVPAIPGEIVPVPETSLSVKVLEFLADFTYDIDTRTAGLASPKHDNPAVFVQVLEDGALVGEQWLFAGTAGHGATDIPYRLFFLDYTPDFGRGLTLFEFTRQPGTPLVFTGFAALSLGLCLVFWTRRSAPDVPPE